MKLLEALAVNGEARRPDWHYKERLGFENDYLLVMLDSSRFPARGVHLTQEDVFAEDWEPYKEPVPSYTFSEAAAKWKKFRRRAWKSCTKDRHLFWWKDEIDDYEVILVKERRVLTDLAFCVRDYDFYATDWEEYAE